MKGFGTDEAAIISVWCFSVLSFWSTPKILGFRGLQQRLDIKNVFKTMYGKSLEEWVSHVTALVVSDFL
jgi:hypothetical protein